MNTYPTLMQPDLERFEQLFFYKKKSLEEFINLMTERAELEENYAKAVARLSTNLSVFSENSPLGSIMNSLKSYHAMRSEQSRTLATSLKEEVIMVLRNMLKKESDEAKKMLIRGKKNDFEMSLVLEKIETTRRRYVSLNSEIGEAERAQGLLNNTESTESQIEEKKKALEEKVSKLTSARVDCDEELKKSIDAYNDFKKSFIDECNSVVDYFKRFDINRLESFRDSTMKYFVFEISYLRNIQYDVNKIFQHVETAEFAKDVEESIVYAPKKEPASMEFEKFKEMFIDTAAIEERNKGNIIFEKTQIPENLGFTNAFKSIVGLFANPKAADQKKKEEEKKFIEAQWEAFSKGQTISEINQLRLCQLLAQPDNRRVLSDLFATQEINLSNVDPETAEQIRDSILQTLQHLLIEAWEHNGFESLRYYYSTIKKFNKLIEAAESQENLYSYVDENLSSMAIFNNEERWREFFTRVINNSTETLANQEKVVKIGRVRREIVLMRHFFHKEENMIELIKSIATEAKISEEDLGHILAEEYIEPQKENIQEIKKEESRENQKSPLDDWLQKMEQKISEVGKNRKIAGGIFSFKTKRDTTPTRQRMALEPRDSILNESVIEDGSRPSERPRKKIFDMSGFDQNKIKQEDIENTNNNISFVSTDFQE